MTTTDLGEAGRRPAARPPATAAGVFRMTLQIDVVPGREPEFERTWLGIAEAVGADPGNLGQWLLRDAQRPDRYLVVSDWLDEDRFRRFETSAAHVANRRALAAYRRGGAMHTTVVVAHHENAAGPVRGV
jgi:heme-degrading monooxygenase HmoA